MPHIVKALLLTIAALIALLTGGTVALLTHADGASLPDTITAGGVGFAGTLTLIVLIITTYKTL
ncbi:hypothetical protein [Nocardia gipuzkoensis]|uniref:hypothetical protein n=1 Tax=Nocardia gipuzkoensis TaxID=2749991 RepID=UPI0015EE4BA7|nr:hypothetical protein [Nocardia gipuzkoensis]